MDVLKRYKWVFGGLAAIVLVLAFLAFRPDKLFVDDRVDESLQDAFPVVSTVTSTTDLAATATTTTMGEDETTTTEMAEETTTTTMTEDGTTTTAMAEDETTTTVATNEQTTATDAASSGPIVVATGPITGFAHEASGTATIYEQDGAYVLRFEDDTEIFNGPDLYVYLLNKDEYEQGNLGAYIDLGNLKGNVGGQNYELPEEYDPAVHHFALVWCKRFSVPFAGALVAP
jgi:hypothetical protein